MTVWTIILAGMTAVPTPGFFGIYELSAYGALSIWFVEESRKTFAVILHLGQLGSLFFGRLFFNPRRIVTSNLHLKALSKIQKHKGQNK